MDAMTDSVILSTLFQAQMQNTDLPATMKKINSNLVINPNDKYVNFYWRILTKMWSDAISTEHL